MIDSPTASTLDQLRTAANEAAYAGNYLVHTCWNCLPAYEDLKETVRESLLECPACGHFYFRDMDITMTYPDEVASSNA